MEVEMKIRGLMMDPVTNMPIVVLKDVQGQAILPIWVGVYEANAIALEIEKVQTPRPMTHDLLKNVFLGLEVRVQKVVVNDLKDDTFYALIWVERDGEMMTIDSRPSDALALALRVDCPIFVEDEVLKNSKISSAISERTTNEQLRSWLEGLSDDDLGRYKMLVPRFSQLEFSTERLRARTMRKRTSIDVDDQLMRQAMRALKRRNEAGCCRGRVALAGSGSWANPYASIEGRGSVGR